VPEDLPSTQQQALSEADKWRRRYEVEAQQRRKEYAIAQKTIQQLRAEVQQLCQLRPSTTALPPSHNQQPGLTLQEALTQAETERDQLAAALAQEQEAHARTRDNLIGALSDAIGSGRSPGTRSSALPEGRP
jgi:DNA-binding helix-hairpin-helix protein with protein kinase domain